MPQRRSRVPLVAVIPLLAGGGLLFGYAAPMLAGETCGSCNCLPGIFAILGAIGGGAIGLVIVVASVIGLLVEEGRKAKRICTTEE